jgi:hypothetical protein
LNEAKNDFSLESTKLPSFVCSIMNHKEEEPLWLTEDLSFKKMKEMVERTVSFSDE